MKKIRNIFDAAEGKVVNESILDVPQKERATWLIDENGKINKEIKKQIYSILRNFRNQVNFKFDIDKIEAKGSLLGKRYTEDSDIDISVYTDMSKEQRDSIINIVPKGNKIVVDGKETNHPIDIYILSKGEHTPENNLDNIYDVAEEKWIKKTEEYSLDIPLNYALEVSNFFINGAAIAISNFDNDKAMYEFYKSLDPETQDIDKDEKEKALIEQRKKLQADGDALGVCQHMLSAFRHEAYNEEPQPFKISIELTNDNPHNTINEVMLKLFEKFGIRQKLKEKSEECAQLLENEKPHEEVSQGEKTE